MKWQPISSAPRDGKYIIGCNKDIYFPVVICFASYHPNAEGKFCWRTAKIGGNKITGITHWMPLPSPPTDALEPK